MQAASSVAQARALLAPLPRPVGFVPTMGALHAGHLALVRAARENNASVAVSVFVNPLQFGPGEDFARYPRDIDADRLQLDAAGVDMLFAPSVDTVYPEGFSTGVDVGEMAKTLEGAVRPGHFVGVATIVMKLLQIIAPDILYVGQKDAQQTAVLRRMIRDLNVPVTVEIVETVRELDGLALSSRNAYLSAAERAQAPTLFASLVALRDALVRNASKEEAIEAARAVLSSSANLDYYEVVDAGTFAPLDALRPPAFILGAAHFGATRLIDNIWVRA